MASLDGSQQPTRLRPPSRNRYLIDPKHATISSTTDQENIQALATSTESSGSKNINLTKPRSAIQIKSQQVPAHPTFPSKPAARINHVAPQKILSTPQSIVDTKFSKLKKSKASASRSRPFQVKQISSEKKTAIVSSSNRARSSQQPKTTTYQQKKSLLIGEILNTWAQLRSEETGLLRDYEGFTHERHEYEELESQLGQQLLKLKYDEAANETLMESQEKRVREMRTQLQQLKAQTSSLTREILSIDAEAESCRSSTHQLLELFETAKYKRADAAKFIPTLQQNVMATTKNVVELESQLLNDITSVIRLEVRIQLVLKDIYWICRLWSPSGPSRGHIRLELNPPKSTPVETRSEMKLEVQDGGPEFEVSVFQSSPPPCSVLNQQTFDPEYPNHSTWVRVSRCAHDSEPSLHLPAHSIEIPFDTVITFDPVLSPHSLVLANWQDVKPPSSLDSFVVERRPKISLVDTFEHRQHSHKTNDSPLRRASTDPCGVDFQILQHCEIFIEELLDPYGIPDKPLHMGFVCLGSPSRTDENRKKENYSAFWGSTNPRTITERPICGTFSLPPEQPARIPGLLETGIRSVFRIIEQRNGRAEERDDGITRSFHSSNALSKISSDQEWWIEGSITICPPHTLIASSASTEEESSLSPIPSKSIRRSISTPSSYVESETNHTPIPQEITTTSLNDSIAAMLKDFQDLPGMSLVGATPIEQDEIANHLKVCQQRNLKSSPLLSSSSSVSTPSVSTDPHRTQETKVTPTTGSDSKILSWPSQVAVKPLNLDEIIRTRTQHSRSRIEDLGFLTSRTSAMDSSSLGLLIDQSPRAQIDLQFQRFDSVDELLEEIQKRIRLSPAIKSELSTMDPNNADPSVEWIVPSTPLHTAIALKVHPPTKTTNSSNNAYPILGPHIFLFVDAQVSQGASERKVGFESEDPNIADLFDAIIKFPHPSSSVEAGEDSESHSSTVKPKKRNHVGKLSSRHYNTSRQFPTSRKPSREMNLSSTLPTFRQLECEQELLASYRNSPIGQMVTFFMNSVTESIHKKKQRLIRGRQLGITETNSLSSYSAGGCLAVVTQLDYPRMFHEEMFRTLIHLKQLIQQGKKFQPS